MATTNLFLVLESHTGFLVEVVLFLPTGVCSSLAFSVLPNNDSHTNEI